MTDDRITQWEQFEQAWLSDKMSVLELQLRRSADDDFNKWFESRVEHRLKLTSPSQYDQLVKKQSKTST